MKKYLLPNDKKAYKANLHCHSTISDGCLTPEQLKSAYKNNGYSILSITDHEYLVDHSSLSDNDFLLITGYELSIQDPPEIKDPYRTNYHLNLYARDPHNVMHVLFNPFYCELGDRSIIATLKYDGDGKAIRIRSADGANEVIAEAKKKGFIVSFNHPTWSKLLSSDYLPLEGLFAMEVFNFGSYMSGRHAVDIRAYDEMLRRNKHICCLASDDNHNEYPLDNGNNDSFGGFTMVYSESLTYENIIQSLEKGQCYASAGPMFEELYYEDGYVYVKSSPVKGITLQTCGWRQDTVVVNEGEILTEAKLSVKEDDGYIRIVLTDFEGKNAYSRGYFLDELEGE